MLKQFFATILVASVAVPAFAQRDSVEVSRTAPRVERSSFNEYVMHGISAGLEYSSMGAEGHIKVKSKDTGLSTNVSASTDKDVSALGVSASYASVPRGGAGWIAGLALINKLENDKNDKDTASLGNIGSMMQIRPELNAAYAFTNGIYGAIGGHASVLTGDDIQDVLSPVGFGLQVQVGYVPVRNVAMDIGYYISNHKVSDKLKDNASKAGLEVDNEGSSYNVKQFRARVSYNF